MDLKRSLLLCSCHHLEPRSNHGANGDTVAQVFSAALKLDGPTLTNLELLESSLGGPVGSLLARLDSCVTPGATCFSI